MSDADALDAASDRVDSGPAATTGHSIDNYGSSGLKKVAVPEKPQARMGGIPPEQWSDIEKRDRTPRKGRM